MKKTLIICSLLFSFSIATAQTIESGSLNITGYTESKNEDKTKEILEICYYDHRPTKTIIGREC